MFVSCSLVFTFPQVIREPKMSTSSKTDEAPEWGSSTHRRLPITTSIRIVYKTINTIHVDVDIN